MPRAGLGEPDQNLPLAEFTRNGKKKHAYKNRKRDVAADCFRAFPCKTERIKQKLAISARFRCSSNTERIVTIELS